MYIRPHQISGYFSHKESKCDSYLNSLRSLTARFSSTGMDACTFQNVILQRGRNNRMTEIHRRSYAVMEGRNILATLSSKPQFRHFCSILPFITLQSMTNTKLSQQSPCLTKTISTISHDLYILERCPFLCITRGNHGLLRHSSFYGKLHINSSVVLSWIVAKKHVKFWTPTDAT